MENAHPVSHSLNASPCWEISLVNAAVSSGTEDPGFFPTGFPPYLTGHVLRISSVVAGPWLAFRRAYLMAHHPGREFTPTPTLYSAGRLRLLTSGCGSWIGQLPFIESSLPESQHASAVTMSGLAYISSLRKLKNQDLWLSCALVGRLPCSLCSNDDRLYCSQETVPRQPVWQQQNRYHFCHN